MYETKYPHSFCEPTCPRQRTHEAKDCECGGAQQEWDYWKLIGAHVED